MRRHALGVLSLVLLLTAGWGWLFLDLDDSQVNVLISACQRIGLVLGAAWLAFPQLEQVLARTSVWFVLLMSGIGLMILIRPRAIIVLGPAMLLLAVLQFVGWIMKPPRRAPRRTDHP